MLIRIFDLAQCAGTDLSVLNEEERSAAARYRFEEDRVRFSVARALLRTIIGEALSVDPRALRLTTGPHGKPRVEGIEFNISHSGDRIAIALDREPVGIDVERVDVRRDTAGLAARFFNRDEIEWIATQRDPVFAFFRLWTMKESVMKADGRGMALPVKAIVVDPPSLRASAEGRIWRMVELDAGEGYAACVATASPIAPKQS